MTKVVAGITTSLDGYITGPNDGPGVGLGEGGERLHYWVFGGRNTYEAADAWGGENPWGVPFFILTHRPQDEPPGKGFTFVSGLDDAVSRAREAAGNKDVSVMGGADTIRQALRGGFVEELSISIAPVVLGAGKRLFEGFTESLNLEPIRVLESPFATHLSYRVVR
jgi:dihydrofolate reductase